MYFFFIIKKYIEIFVEENLLPNLFFSLGFLSQTVTNYSAAGEGGGHFFNSSLPLPPAS